MLCCLGQQSIIVMIFVTPSISHYSPWETKPITVSASNTGALQSQLKRCESKEKWLQVCFVWLKYGSLLKKNKSIPTSSVTPL